jgi:CO/xanthine dehydrogenase FAD-binding subunit
MAAETLVPSSAEEAVQLFGDGDGITVFAGGTILMPEIAAGRLKPTRALLLHRSGLDELRTDGDVIRIGAMVPVAALADGDGLLARFAEQVADLEVRAAATVGGNLCASAGGLGAQKGDLGAPLIALGARVRSDGKGGERTEAVEDFLAGDRTGRLVLEIEYDRPAGSWSAQTMRRRHAHSYAIANVAVCSAGDGLRVGVSGVGAAAVRARTVEQSRNAEDVLEDVDPVDDAVASAEYRRKMLVVLVRRALEEVASA